MLSPKKPKNLPDAKILSTKRSTSDDLFFRRSTSRTCPNLPKPRGRKSVVTAINLPRFFFGNQPEAPADFGLHIVAKFLHQVHVNFLVAHINLVVTCVNCKLFGHAMRPCFCTPSLNKSCSRITDTDFTKIR